MPESSTQQPPGRAVYSAIIDEIRRGDLLPGARLREVELAEQFNTSRTPVREALRLLEADGLVRHLPRQGAVVRQLEFSEIMELYEMRAVLEGTAARLAARAASDAELAELAALNEEFRAAGDDELQAAAINRQFHATLQAAARNRFLLQSVGVMEKTMLILGRTTMIEPARAQTACEEHDRIIAALNARDGQTAEAEMRAHIEAAQRTRLKVMRAVDRDNDVRLWSETP